MKELSASAITADALLILRAKGYRVRRVNNVGAYKKRAHQVESGWVDIQGYCKQTGKVVLAEVKKIGDKIRPEQKELLLECKESGGIALVAYQGKSGVEIVDIENYLG